MVQWVQVSGFYYIASMHVNEINKIIQNHTMNKLFNLIRPLCWVRWSHILVPLDSLDTSHHIESLGLIFFINLETKACLVALPWSSHVCQLNITFEAAKNKYAIEKI